MREKVKGETYDNGIVDMKKDRRKACRGDKLFFLIKQQENFP
jgi:hypothetical protein